VASAVGQGATAAKAISRSLKRMNATTPSA